MQRTLTTLLGLAALLLAADGELRAENVFGEITVIAAPGEASQSFMHGYIEHRFHISNRSVGRAHRVTLVMPDKSYASPGSIRHITREVVVAPGAAVAVSLFQLPMEMAGSAEVRVLVDGRNEGNVANPLVNFMYPLEPFRILVSRTVAASQFEQNIKNIFAGETNPPVATAMPPYPGRPPSEDIFKAVRSELEPPYWKDNWLAYSSFDGIVLAGADLPQMAPAAKLAILRYLECGGTLLVSGACDLIPPSWNQSKLEWSSGLTGYQVGFGQCIVSPYTPLASLNREQLVTVRQMWQRSRQPWLDLPDPARANEGFPVVDQVTLPLRALFILMLCFVVAIELNFVVLYRRKRPIWILWTAPLLSGLTAAGVMIYAFLSEGTTPTFRLEGVTILDQRQHHATTIGLAGYYFPIAPGAGLSFGFDTELTPLVSRGWHGREGGLSKTIDFSRSQQLASGWIAARAPVFFKLRKSEPRRERLEIKPAGSNGLAVVNGLGAEIGKLWVADKEGRVFTAGAPIPAGKQALLAPAGAAFPAAPTLERLNTLYAGNSWTCPDDGNPAGLLFRGGYAAHLAAAPFLEKGSSKKAHEKYKTLVVGFWEAE
jgi:hypothetical protein